MTPIKVTTPYTMLFKRCAAPPDCFHSGIKAFSYCTSLSLMHSVLQCLDNEPLERVLLRNGLTPSEKPFILVH